MESRCQSNDNAHKYLHIHVQEYHSEWYQEATEQVVQKLDAYLKNGSWWIVETIEKVTVVITSHRHFNPLKGHGDMELPNKLKGKHALINLEGVQEGECFKYSILASIYRHKICHPKHVLARKYKRFIDQLNFDDISNPTDTKKDIDKFEQQNPTYVVGIFQWDEESDKMKVPVTLIRSPSSKKTSGKTILMMCL